MKHKTWITTTHHIYRKKYIIICMRHTLCWRSNTSEPLYSTHPSPSLAWWYWQQSCTQKNYNQLVYIIAKDNTCDSFQRVVKPDTILLLPWFYSYKPRCVNYHTLYTVCASTPRRKCQQYSAPYLYVEKSSIQTRHPSIGYLT